MTTTTDTTVPYFDITDPDFSITSQEVHDAREQSWYARTNLGIAVLRYEEAGKLLKHPNVRQGSFRWLKLNGIEEGEMARWFDTWILHFEGAPHFRLRRLMNPAFTIRAIAPLGPKFAQLAEDLVAGIVDKGECEFVSEFVDPYVAKALTIMMGLPEEIWAQIGQDAATVGLILGVTVKKDKDRIEAALKRLDDYAVQLIAERRAEPKDDFIGLLVSAGDKPGGLSDRELRDNISNLIFGAYDTTRHQIGLAMQTFLEHPEQWRILGDNPELADAAVEEVMRVNPTTRWVTRYVNETFEFQGVEFKEGTSIHVFNETTGTDPRAFEHGGEFDIRVKKPGHYAFGAGAHHCLGHFMARSDMAEALRVLSRRMRDIKPAEGAVFAPDSGNTGPIRLPITFTPAP
jgi:cytochrome P450